VRQLLPLSAYEVTRSANFARLAFAMAVWWFVFRTIVDVATARYGLGETLIIDAVGAVVFGVLFAVAMHWSMDRQVTRLYEGRGAIVPEPTGHYGYDFRVLCSLLRGRVRIGGHLYVGPENWVFVPHPKNRRSRRQPIRWEHPERIALSTEPAQLWWLQKFVGVRATDRLVVSDGGLRERFVVPDAQFVRDELEVHLMSAHSP